MRYPFTLYKVKSNLGTMWHARFWDETLQRYAHSRTTGVLVEGKREQRREAEEAARKLILEVQEAKTTQSLPIVNSSTKTVANTPLAEYLENFWQHDSQYANYKRNVKKDPLLFNYLKNNHEDIHRHVIPYSEF